MQGVRDRLRDGRKEIILLVSERDMDGVEVFRVVFHVEDFLELADVAFDSGELAFHTVGLLAGNTGVSGFVAEIVETVVSGVDFVVDGADLDL